MTTITTYYVDMDGVLADFFAEHDAVARCTIEADFFTNLAPITVNVEAVRALVNAGAQVYICSNSKNENTDAQKVEWLKKYLPELVETAIFTRSTNKKKFMITDNGVLFDDSAKNCHSWEIKEGNRAFQITAEMTIADALAIV